MRAHFEKFVAEHPDSGRLPEAVYWIGWTHLEEDEPGRARDIYWKTIEALGDDPDRFTMTDLLAGLPKVYAKGGDEAKQDLITKLKLLESVSAVTGKTTLSLRAGWALSLVAEDAEAARIQLLKLTDRVDPKRHEPAITVAVAEAQLASGNRTLAGELFTEIRKWHPRTVERHRIYRALGEIAAAAGDGSARSSFTSGSSARRPPRSTSARCA